MDPDSVQHINVKVFVQDAAAFEPAETVPVFHQWIRDGVCPEMLIDVADYAHVSDVLLGPSVGRRTGPARALPPGRGRLDPAGCR